jgi:hypothetical protein
MIVTLSIFHPNCKDTDRPPRYRSIVILSIFRTFRIAVTMRFYRETGCSVRTLGVDLST